MKFDLFTKIGNRGRESRNNDIYTRDTILRWMLVHVIYMSDDDNNKGKTLQIFTRNKK